MPSMLYLHGFLSSPASAKAKITEKWLMQEYPGWDYHCPSLSSYPDVAKQQLVNLYKTLNDPPFVIGSSLGGFWATWCVEQFGGKAVLINPAVSPHSRFQHYLNQPLKSYYSDEVIRLTQSHIELLAQCDCPIMRNNAAYTVMLQTGDETLDYRLALERYKHSLIWLEEGGNHSFEGYENYLSQIIQFFTSAP